MENYGYLSAMKKYVTFRGRAPRKEFWMYILIYMIGAVVLSFIDGALFGYTTESAGEGSIGGSVAVNYSIFAGIWGLVHFLPSISVSVRRLHDIDKSGWWVLIGLIPLIGFIVLLFFYCKQSDQDENRFGPNPYGVVDAADVF